MIHVYKVGRRTTREVICWQPGKYRLGKADHKYSDETCGWPVDGPVQSALFCCTRCHAHVYNPNQEVCGFCGTKFSLGARVGITDRFPATRTEHSRSVAL